MATTEQNDKQKKEKKKPKIDKGLALYMRLVEEKSYQAIADHFKVSKSGAYDCLKPIEDRLLMGGIIHNKPDVESKIHSAIRLNYQLHLLDPATIKKASANNAAYVLDRSTVNAHLIEGKPTAIEDHRVLSADLTKVILACKQALQQGQLIECQTSTPE